VLEVSTIDKSTVAPPPPLFRGLAGEYVRGIVRRKDRLIIFLDVAHLLTTSERLALSRAGDDASGT
jgi:chemotaxis signal transduction protein